MKKIPQTAKVFGLVLCLGTLPLLTMVTGCAGDRYHQSTGENIDDHGTNMRVKSALSNDAQYKYEDVNVDTFKGVVQLSGFVNTHAQKSRASEIAKGVENVKEVQNNITVKE
jgi:osmotically-inducible protein OsmY